MPAPNDLIRQRRLAAFAKKKDIVFEVTLCGEAVTGQAYQDLLRRIKTACEAEGITINANIPSLLWVDGKRCG